MTAILFKTNGQTVIVHSSSATLYTTSAYSVSVTLPATISADTTYYANPNNGNTAVVVKQRDGTTIWSNTIQLSAWNGSYTIDAEPTPAQVAADAGLTLGFWKSGYYYTNSQDSTSTGAGTADVLYLAPLLVPNACTIDRIGAKCSGAGGAGAVLRLGIYADNGEGYPGALVVDGATIDATSTTAQEVTVDTALSRGLYWAGQACQVGTASTQQTVAAAQVPVPLRGSAIWGAGAVFGYSQASVTGALPATFTTTPTQVTTALVARLSFRVA